MDGHRCNRIPLTVRKLLFATHDRKYVLPHATYAHCTSLGNGNIKKNRMNLTILGLPEVRWMKLLSDEHMPKLYFSLALLVLNSLERHILK